MTLLENPQSVSSRDELVEFIRALQNDFIHNYDQWQNVGVDSFLEGMASWLEDSDGYYANRGEEPPETPRWSTVAEILLAASMYE